MRICPLQRGFRQVPTYTRNVDNRSELIKRLRVERKWLQADVADRIPGKVLSIQRISDRERGRTPVDPSEDALFAAAFGMTVDKFRSLVVEDAQHDQGVCDRGIPIINSAPAGVAINYEEYGVDSRQGFEYLPRDPETQYQDLFAVIVVGESMSPNLMPGDKVVLHPIDSEATDQMFRDRIVFVRFTQEAGAGCCLARWVPIDDDKVKLAKDNPKHKSRTFRRDTIERAAVAIQLRRVVK